MELFAMRGRRSPDPYRVLISILLGCAGFAVNFLDIEIVHFPELKLSILAGLIFPLLVALAWGWKYGLLSALAGGGQSMWWLWRADGYGLFYSVPVFTLWIVWHGYWAEVRQRMEEPRWYRSSFAVELPFRLVVELGFFTVFRGLIALNPPFWDPSITTRTVSMAWLQAMAVKHVISAYVFLMAGHALLSLTPVRRFFRLPQEQSGRLKNAIYSAAVLLGLLLWWLDSVFTHLWVDPGGRTFWQILAFDVTPDRLLTRNLYLVVAVAGGIGVARLIDRRLDLEAVQDRLNRVLKTVRNVNQLITRESDASRLLDRSCRTMVEINGYAHAWIARTDPEGGIVSLHGAGVGESFETMRTRIEEGFRPPCVERVLGTDAVRVVKDPAGVCGECPLVPACEDRIGMTARLQHGGRIYGWVSVSVPEGRTDLNQERELLQELAGDLALALDHSEQEAARVQSEQALQRERDRVKRITESTPVGIILLGSGGLINRVNPAAEEILGWSAEEALGRSFDDPCHPCWGVDDDPSTRPAEPLPFEQVRRTGRPVYQVRRGLTRPDGARRVVSVSARPLFDAQGDFDGVVAVIEDVTDREKVESDLECIEWLLEQESLANDPVAPYTPYYGDVTELNTDRTILEAVPGETMEMLAEDIMVLVDSSVAVYERSGDYAYGIFASGWCQLLDAASRRLCGTDDNREALDGGRWLCHECCWNRSARPAMETGAPTDIECVGGIRLYAVPIRANGEIIGVINLGYGDPPRDPDRLRELAERFRVSYDRLEEAARAYKPRPAFIVEVAKRRLQSAAHRIGSIVERNRAEAALARSEQRLNSILNAQTNAVIMLNTDLTIAWTNRAACESVGEDPDGLKGQYCFARWGENSGPCPGCPALEAMHLRRTRHAHRVTPDGCEWEVVATPVFDRAGEVSGMVAVGEDVTEKRELEEQYRQAQKMEAIGRIASGVAHDFNNILQSITGYTELARSQAADRDPDLKAYLEEVMHATARAQSLTQQLLIYTRKQQMRPVTLDLNEKIEAMDSVAHLTLGEHVAYVFHPQTPLDSVRIDPNQLEQLFMNLLVNARDAMDGGGRVTVETHAVTLDEEFADRYAMPRPGRYVQLVVADTGCGMDAETRKRIFDPFFTTKDVGKGTGLGLSTVQGIVRQHDGRILVYSEPGRGTAFKMYFPAVTRPRHEVETAEETDAAGGDETLFLCEDDEDVRKWASSVLRRAGYTVHVSRDGSEGLEKVGELADVIDLAVLDVIMPGGDGPQVAGRLAAKKGSPLPVVFISGYSDAHMPEAEEVDYRFTLLQKPCSATALLDAIRAMLD
ncbi:PAS domain S-box protein [Kiritimatiella glycovorans]|uniref:histidine kinase n=1 Tax=Kiritimatiella glycovorans TaxID=1307763 RepID=A0A0G3EDW6_9BACT|nr:PAS domain S-box protein [Kiritimatiella glycovorans]AKJ64651.1 Multi-sensor hybrid histidine kinase [Kiritimatiella glycovorans]